MKKDIQKEKKAFYSNPDEWVKAVEQDLNNYIAQSTDIFKNYVKLLFDQAYEAYQHSKQNPLAEIIIQNNFADFVLIKSFFARKDNILPEILSLLDPTNTTLCLLEVAESMQDCEYWNALGDSYTQKEFVHVPSNILKMLFLQPKGSIECLMNEEERQFLESLPNKIMAYRAMSREEERSNEFRISWTLSEEVAYDFVEKQSLFFDISDSFVKSQVIDKNHVIAYFNGRNEEEVIFIKK